MINLDNVDELKKKDLPELEITFPDGRIVNALKVQKKMCNTCVFRNKPFTLTLEKFTEILNEGDNNFVPCHESHLLKEKHSNICCRGFYERYKHVSKPLIFAEQLGKLTEVDCNAFKGTGINIVDVEAPK